MTRWGSIVLLLLALGTLWAIAFWCFPRLPAQFPAHFDGSGTPDRWVQSSPGQWFLLPLIGTGVALMMTLIAFSLGWFAREYPGLVNVPQPKLFRQLSPERRQRVLAPCASLLQWVGAWVLALFATILWGTYLVATQQASTLGLWPIFVALPAILGGVAWGMWRVRGLILAEWAQQSMEQDQANARASR